MTLFGKKTKQDLKPNEKLFLIWTQEKSSDSINKLFEFSLKLAADAINWYASARSSKKIWARLIRFIIIILGASAALLPTLGELFPIDSGKTRFAAGWTTVLLGVAGALLLLDRYFGFSSGWMRYIVAEQQLRQISQEFQMDWEAARVSWQSESPTPDQVTQMLARCKTFISQVNTIVREETNLWVREFQNTIDYLDESIKAKPAVSEPGAINLTITNGNEVVEGWKLTIDEGREEIHQGRTAGKRNMVPGKHQIKVEAIISNQKKQAEKVVSVPVGGTCEETLTLS